MASMKGREKPIECGAIGAIGAIGVSEEYVVDEACIELNLTLL